MFPAVWLGAVGFVGVRALILGECCIIKWNSVVAHVRAVTVFLVVRSLPCSELELGTWLRPRFGCSNQLYWVVIVRVVPCGKLVKSPT